MCAFWLSGTCCVLADDVEPLVADAWECGTKVEPSSEIAAFFDVTYAYTGDDGRSAFVAGTLKHPDGWRFSMIFHRKEAGWQGYAVEGQAGFWNAFMSRDGSRAVLFSAINVGGPGQSYTVAASGDGFETIRCGVLPAPDTELGTIDFMTIDSFALDEAGKGRITGSVSYADGRPVECFESASDDGGVNWSQPKKLPACIDNSFMELAPVDGPDGPAADFGSLRFF
jgi:hypothetical protein